MLLIRFYQPADKSFDKYILTHGGIITEEHIKLNLTLYMNPDIFLAFLNVLLQRGSVSHIRRTHSEYRGNCLPSDFLRKQNLHIFEVGDDVYEVVKIGVEYDTALRKGHLEIKYQLWSGDSVEKYFILNFHVERDYHAAGKDLKSYLKIFSSQFSRNRVRMLQKISELGQLTVENFRRFGFDVAYRSREYFLVLMLTNCYLAHHDHLYQVSQKWMLFQEMMADRAWDMDDDGYGYELDSPGYRLNQYWCSGTLPRNDYSFLALSRLPHFFSPVRMTEEVDDYGAPDELGAWPGTAYATSDDPVELCNAQFVRCDLRDLDFHRESTFRKCNFNQADLRGAIFYVNRMDLATLVTLKNALLDARAEAEVLAEIERHRGGVRLRY